MTEGGKKLIFTYKYERNPRLKKKALEEYGYSCSVCGFDFEETYGSLGKEFTEVHHIVPVSEGERENDYRNLVPLCPNCHRMIHRLYALGAHLSAEERQAVADGLLIQPLIGSLPNIMAPEWFDGLKRAAEGRRLMVLDTLRRFHIEEENASGPMAQVIGRMEAIAADTGCSIVFLHHASKGAAMMGAGDQQQASRGSSVLVDNIRWQSYLSSMTSAEAEEWGVDDDQRRFFVRFGVSKANYGAPFADRWFRRHDGGVLKPAVLERQRKSKGVPRGEA